MVDTTITQDALQTDIYDRIGVRTVINGRGATTAVGGSLMRPEVLSAMVEASKAFVVIEDLNARVGETIAEITGAEAGYVTNGSAAGMLLSVAACIAGTDPELIRRLPETEGMRNEVIVHRSHRTRLRPDVPRGRRQDRRNWVAVRNAGLGALNEHSLTAQRVSPTLIRETPVPARSISRQWSKLPTGAIYRLWSTPLPRFRRWTICAAGFATERTW